MNVETKVPEIRFKGFNGDISIKNLKEIIITNTYGPRFNANDYDSNGNVKTIRGTDISIDGRVLYNQVPLASLEVNFIKEHILEDGDLVMITTADCGLTGLFEEQTDKYICSAYAVKVTLDQELASPLYFKYFFQTTLAKIEINKFIRKATVANLPASAILQIAHKIPCRKEQTAIGNYFKNLDSLINQHQQKHDKLTSIKKSMLEKMFPKQGETIPEIRFKGFRGEWEVEPFGVCFANIPNNTLSRAEMNYEDGTAKNIHYGDVLIKFGEVLDATNELLPFITKNDVANKLKHAALRDGDIIIADAAEDSMVGKCTELFNIDEQLVLSGLHTIAVRPTLPFASKYLGYYLNSSSYHDQLLSLMQGTKVLSISKTAIQNTNVGFPKSVEEQTAIGNYFQKLDSLINQHQQQITKLNNIKQACLNKMFV